LNSTNDTFVPSYHATIKRRCVALLCTFYNTQQASAATIRPTFPRLQQNHSLLEGFTMAEGECSELGKCM
jgi:hypothetical protein